MNNWFSVIAAGFELPASAVRELDAVGFVVVPGPVAPSQLSRLAAVYDAVVSAADPADCNSGRTTTRVSDFVNRAPEFDNLYVYQPILEACCRIIGAPFHLSTMHARAVNPGAPAQALHADYQRTTDAWPMVGFIFMVDEFRRDNGATRFVPGSHRWPHAPSDVMPDATADYEGQVSARGPAGSVIIYNGSVWHGHAANQTRGPRRSIQGAFIRRGDKQGTNQAARIRPDTRERIGALAKYILNIEPLMVDAAALPTE
jgi:ectoine hydroxylase-related dioxygenase (phytanoyl-CoA dioxygenase family)